MDDTTPPIHDPPVLDPARPRYRAPVGLPHRDEGRAAGAVVSIVIHALIIGLLIVPFFLPSSVIARMRQGAGGTGPAGGGGGGNDGGAATIETLHFVKVGTQPVPTPTTLPPVPAPKLQPPKLEPPKPVVPPPPRSTTPSPSVPAPAPGAGAGGVGAQGSSGAGPGSGGGIGAGTGTGKGGLAGPGTGGGTQANYSPQPIAMFLPPVPWPSSVRGFRFTAEFDVDSTGRVLEYTFTPTPDGGYNRQLAGLLRSIRFKPGTRPDGTPTRMKAQIGFDF